MLWMFVILEDKLKKKEKKIFSPIYASLLNMHVIVSTQRSPYFLVEQRTLNSNPLLHLLSSTVLKLNSLYVNSDNVLTLGFHIQYPSNFRRCLQSNRYIFLHISCYFSNFSSSVCILLFLFFLYFFFLFLCIATYHVSPIVKTISVCLDQFYSRYKSTHKMSTDFNSTGLTTTGTGGDDMLYDLNVRYNRGDMAWVATAGALCFIMVVPGVGFLYSGLARKKHALSLIWASVMACCLITFQWFFWGFSLTFSHSVKSGMIGSLQFFSLMNVLGAPSVGSTAIPDLLFCFFQLMFAIITGALMLGGACERARLGPMMVFLFVWMTLVYNFVACWTWNSGGWIFKLGAMDYAGGGPVHQASGISALAYALILGKRNDPTAIALPKYKPHSVTNIVIGTIFLWFGWLGFNGGSGLTSTIRAWYACMNTMIAASCGGLTWLFVDYFRMGKRWTTAGMCMGVIAGLVGITPGAGFVSIYCAVPVGVVCAIACNYAVDLKNILKIDDGMDVFSLHAVGGFVGSCLTGLFAADYVAASDGSAAAGTPSTGGWLNKYYRQLGLQLAASTSILLWAFVMTSLILLIMDRIPFLKLRLSEEEEELGTDAAQIGEFVDDQVFIAEPVRSATARESLTGLAAVVSRHTLPAQNDAATADEPAPVPKGSSEEEKPVEA